MTVSPTDAIAADRPARPRRRLSAVLGILLFAACQVAPAAAQDPAEEPIGEPLRLVPLAPDDADGATPAPAPETPDAQAADQAAPAESAPEETAPDERADGPAADAPEADAAAAPAGPEGIEVDTLDEMELETLGTLDTASGALGAAMWEDTPRRRVEALLPRLPASVDAPVLRDLARRLLLSPAAAPERRQADSGGRDLLAIRIDRLAALGAVEEMTRLIRALPRSTESPGVARHRVEGLLLTHRRARACQGVRDAVRRSDAAFWQQALAVCQLADGARAQADLTVRLLREDGAADAGFLALYDAAQGAADTLPDGLPAALGPLHLSLIDLGGLPLPGDRLTAQPTGVLRALATGGHGALALRTAAAERAVARGALAPARLADLYAAFEFSEEQLASAASRDGGRDRSKLAPVRRHALLYQAVEVADAPAAKARVLGKLLDGRSGGDYLAAARLLAEPLAGIEATPKLAWFAATAGRALYAAGRPDAAAAWLRMAQQEAMINPNAAAAVTALWPYAVLSGAAEVPANGGLATWRQAQDDASAQTVGRRESLLRASLAAFGREPERSWVEIALDAPVAPHPAPPAALVYALEDAGRGGRRGETVLLTLLTLGPGGLADCHPAALGTAITALERVGLEPAARRLAVEAAVLNGI